MISLKQRGERTIDLIKITKVFIKLNDRSSDGFDV